MTALLLPFAVLASVFTLNWHATPIYCTSMSGAPWDAVGVYHDTTTHTIEVRSWECDAIAQASRGVVSDNAAIGVWVVGHELAHADGIADEHTADCVGLAFFYADAGALGVPLAVAARLLPLVPEAGGPSQQGCTS